MIKHTYAFSVVFTRHESYLICPFSHNPMFPLGKATSWTRDRVHLTGHCCQADRIWDSFRWKCWIRAVHTLQAPLKFVLLWKGPIEVGFLQESVGVQFQTPRSQAKNHSMDSAEGFLLINPSDQTRPRAGWARITGPPLAMDGSKVLCKSLGHVWGAQKRRPTERSSQPSGPAQRLTSLGLAKAWQIPGKQTSHEGRNESEDASKAEVYCSTCLMLNWNDPEYIGKVARDTTCHRA